MSNFDFGLDDCSMEDLSSHATTSTPITKSGTYIMEVTTITDSNGRMVSPNIKKRPSGATTIGFKLTTTNDEDQVAGETIWGQFAVMPRSDNSDADYKRKLGNCAGMTLKGVATLSGIPSPQKYDFKEYKKYLELYISWDAPTKHKLTQKVLVYVREKNGQLEFNGVAPYKKVATHE